MGGGHEGGFPCVYYLSCRLLAVIFERWKILGGFGFGYVGTNKITRFFVVFTAGSIIKGYYFVPWPFDTLLCLKGEVE